MVKLEVTVNGNYIEAINEGAQQYAYQLYWEPASLTKLIIYGRDYFVESILVDGGRVRVNLAK